jgi:hypothetical protein
MLRKSFFLLVLTLVALLQISPVPLRAWDLGPAGLVPAVHSPGAVPLPPVTQADFDGDGIPEMLSLADGRAAILSGVGQIANLSYSEIAWQSPESWQVVQAAISDLNHDGAPEVTLLVWRPFQPWPVDQWLPHGGRIDSFHDAADYSCHIILIGWRDGQYGEVWAGSALAEPINNFAAADLDGDGRQELVTLEGTYAGPRSAPARRLKVWEWNGFGFTVVSSVDGTFDKMALVRDNEGRTLILVP